MPRASDDFWVRLLEDPEYVAIAFGALLKRVSPGISSFLGRALKALVRDRETPVIMALLADACSSLGREQFESVLRDAARSLPASTVKTIDTIARDCGLPRVSPTTATPRPSSTMRANVFRAIGAPSPPSCEPPGWSARLTIEARL